MMKWIKSYIFALILVVPFTSCVNNKNISIILHPQKTGIATIRFYDESRDRPMITEVWYPIADHIPAEKVNGLWQRCPEARDAPLKQSSKKYPLIVMSHGNGGDRTNNAWIAEILAANGYVVASVDHHGNTWNNKIAENFIKIWERPQDVSYVIDQILEHQEFGSSINRKKIGFIGYSLGGHTGIWIAGGQIATLVERIFRSKSPSDPRSPSFRHCSRGIDEPFPVRRRQRREQLRQPPRVGPALPSPIVRPSTATTAAISPIVPVQNISSAR